MDCPADNCTSYCNIAVISSCCAVHCISSLYLCSLYVSAGCPLSNAALLVLIWARKALYRTSNSRYVLVFVEPRAEWPAGVACQDSLIRLTGSSLMYHGGTQPATSFPESLQEFVRVDGLVTAQCVASSRYVKRSSLIVLLCEA